MARPASKRWSRKIRRRPGVSACIDVGAVRKPSSSKGARWRSSPAVIDFPTGSLEILGPDDASQVRIGSMWSVAGALSSDLTKRPQASLLAARPCLEGGEDYALLASRLSG